MTSPLETLTEVWVGEEAQILCDDQILLVLNEVEKSDSETWSGISAVMNRYCGGQNLTKKQWNSEGRFSSGKHKDVGLVAIKDYQLRLYGFVRSVNGKKSLILLGVDVKKTDRANQKLLKRIAKRCGDYME